MAGGSKVMHREPLFAPEQVHPQSNGEEKMTCHDSFACTEAKGVNEGGVVLFEEGDRQDQSSQTSPQLTPVSLSLCFLTLRHFVEWSACGASINSPPAGFNLVQSPFYKPS